MRASSLLVSLLSEFAAVKRVWHCGRCLKCLNDEMSHRYRVQFLWRISTGSQGIGNSGFQAVYVQLKFLLPGFPKDVWILWQSVFQSKVIDKTGSQSTSIFWDKIIVLSSSFFTPCYFSKGAHRQYDPYTKKRLIYYVFISITNKTEGRLQYLQVWNWTHNYWPPIRHIYQRLWGPLII